MIFKHTFNKYLLKKILIVNISIYFVVLFVIFNLCFGADLIYIDTTEKSIEYQQIDLACHFYGINLKSIVLGENKNNATLVKNIQNNFTDGLVVSASALQYIDRHKLLSLIKNKGKKISLLVVGIGPETNRDMLKLWSGGILIGVKDTIIAHENGFYKIADLPNLCLELSGQDFPFARKFSPREHILEISDASNVNKIIQVFDQNTDRLFPIYVSTNFDGIEIFFQAGSNLNGETNWQFARDRFFEIAPILIYLKYAFGEKSWHGTAGYANFTIDDPWLIEPYGNLSYINLLKQMQKANFHTTIAFTPWNFDRSREIVVKLLKENPDRFSISIHGNDHDHEEFDIHNNNLYNFKIKQALARMEKFSNLTGLSYDKVMIFPHCIGPEQTLAILKKYNYFATINGNNVPQGTEKIKDPLYSMRTININYENFPSFSRVSPDYLQLSDLKRKIIVDLFLDNPILIYSHQDFFREGENAFNELAEFINRIQPNVQWKSLGNIVQHAYLERLREDGNYDIFAFTSNFIIENKHKKSIIYYIRKEESFKFPLKKVSVDGHDFSYDKNYNSITMVLIIPADEKRQVAIEYSNDLDLTKINISKNGIHLALLRYLSDFRDIVLPHIPLGNWFKQYYYRAGFFKLGLMAVVILVFTSSGIIIFVVHISRKYWKSKRTKP